MDAQAIPDLIGFMNFAADCVLALLGILWVCEWVIDKIKMGMGLLG